MQFEEKLDVIEEDLAQYSRELLDILLKDRTTNENIICATGDYISYGELYAATEQIYASLITGIHSKLIQPQVAKAYEQKTAEPETKWKCLTLPGSATLKTTWWTSIGLVGLMCLIFLKTAPGRQQNGSLFQRISSTPGSIMWMHGELRFPVVRPLIW